MKIAFHDNAMSLFGTTVALYNWAFWGKKLLNFTPIIMYDATHPANNFEVIQKFKNAFDENVFCYTNHSEINQIHFDVLVEM